MKARRCGGTNANTVAIARARRTVVDLGAAANTVTIVAGRARAASVAANSVDADGGGKTEVRGWSETLVDIRRAIYACVSSSAEARMTAAANATVAR